MMTTKSLTHRVKSKYGTYVNPSNPITRSKSHGNNGRFRPGSGNENNRDNHRATISESLSYVKLYSSAILVAIALSILPLHVLAANVLQRPDKAGIKSRPQELTESFKQIGVHSNRQLLGDVIAIKEGADLDLSCPIIVQNEDLIISWTCEEEPASIRSSRIHVTESGKLRIHSAKKGDACNYRCEAVDGFETFSVIIKVIIVDADSINQMEQRAKDRASPTLISVNQPASGSKAITIQSGSQPDAHLAIEMHIQPSMVRVKRNETFSLECTIKHAPNMVAPQIIWLKEYLGGPVDSLDDAFEKNLILLDGVYYHSLNWPRALSYSKQTSSASSAILIKQANYLHSGRYICFAGYSASVMHLQMGSSVSNSQSDPSDQADTKHPIKYKTAQAMVEIDDEQGEADFKASRSRDDGTGHSQIWAYISSNIASIRTMIVVLLMVCSSLAIMRLFALKKADNRKNLRKDVSTSINDSHARNQTQGLANSEQPVAACGSGLDFTPGLRQDRFDLSQVPANSLINDNNPLGERYKFDQALLSERLNCIDSASGYNNDHIYSEIGYKMTANIGEEPYYKQPARMNKI